MVMGTGCVKHNKADLGVVCCKAQDGGGGFVLHSPQITWQSLTAALLCISDTFDCDPWHFFTHRVPARLPRALFRAKIHRASQNRLNERR